MPARKPKPAVTVDEAAEEFAVEKSPTTKKHFTNSTFADRVKAAGRNKRVDNADSK